MDNKVGNAARNYKMNRSLQWRFNKTIHFVEKHLDENAKIYDMGEKNLLSGILSDRGYKVTNTDAGIDLDNDYHITGDFDCVTGFEILEHLVSPYPLLKNIKADKLIVSVPLSLWFAKAYWNNQDEFDRHYHEFEPRQFDMLLEKAGWKIIDSEKWKPKVIKFGVRPVLRNFTDRYYIVYAER